MFTHNQEIFYLTEDYTIETAIYKGKYVLHPYISVLNLYKEDEGNFLINPDFVFNTKNETKSFIDYL